MTERTKTFLELIRLPGMFTAHADILAAFLITGAGFDKLGTLVLLLAATSCLFSAGMALNDFFDAAVDEKERPQRPIPSGRISRTSAGAIGVVLLGAGICTAFFAGTRPFLISLGLACCIMLYNGLLKNLPVMGPLAMASCRYFNFLMGLSVLPFKGWAVIPVISALYIFGVTVLSQKEAEGGHAVKTVAVCALCTGSAALVYHWLYLARVLPVFPGVLLMILFSTCISARTLTLLEKTSPADFQHTMKILLLSIILLDAVIASGAIGIVSAFLMLLPLYIPGFLTARLFRVT
jgi:4-hydroxybenzoate polyprenyltransferase